MSELTSVVREDGPLCTRRSRREPRSRSWVALVAATALLLGACGDSSPSGGGDGGPTPDGTVSGDGGGGSGGAGELTGLSPLGQGVSSPFDATPDPDGNKVYYTAILPSTDDTSDPVGALFVVEPGKQPVKLADGFVSPVSLVVSTDGKTVYVADAGDDGAGDSNTETDAVGAVYKVSASGGQRELLSGTKGYFPRGLDLVADNGQDVLYISGTDPNGTSGVWTTGPAGGTLTAVATGAPLTDPSGVAHAKSGVTYVADTLAADGAALILKIENGKVSTLASGIRVGYPAGIALSRDESVLLVSALQPDVASSVVYRIDVATGKATQFSSGISDNTESAGVHRAHNADRYAWANSADPNPDGTGGGTVFLLGTKANPLPKP